VARLKDRGVAGAIVGRALYENRFDVRQANMAAEKPGSEDDELVES
jgi:phosphoribosylformimino-5-aminoimidazole carboxamide ribonucleotide (ProFAR) isomerase